MTPARARDARLSAAIHAAQADLRAAVGPEHAATSWRDLDALCIAGALPHAAVAQRRAVSARWALVLPYRTLPALVARQRGVPLEWLDDATGAGLEAMHYAAAMWRADGGTAYPWYARRPVVAAIRAWRATSAPVRFSHHAVTAAGQAAALRRPDPRITDAMVAARLAVSMDRLRDLEVRVLPLDAPRTTTGQTWADVLRADTEDPGEALHRADLIRRTLAAVASLDDRTQGIVRRVMTDDTRSDYARRIGLSGERVRQIEVSALSRLREMLGAQP